MQSDRKLIMDDKMSDVPKHETDLSLILRKRLEGIQNEMFEFNNLVHDFTYAHDSEIQKFTVNMGRLQKNLNRVHMMKVEETSNLAAQPIAAASQSAAAHTAAAAATTRPRCRCLRRGDDSKGRMDGHQLVELLVSDAGGAHGLEALKGHQPPAVR